MMMMMMLIIIVVVVNAVVSCSSLPALSAQLSSLWLADALAFCLSAVFCQLLSVTSAQRPVVVCIEKEARLASFS